MASTDSTRTARICSSMAGQSLRSVRSLFLAGYSECMHAMPQIRDYELALFVYIVTLGMYPSGSGALSVLRTQGRGNRGPPCFR